MNYQEFVAGEIAHLKEHETIAPPKDREPDPLDEVVSGVMGALNSATRLYPEVYAWMVADAIRAHLQQLSAGGA